VDSPFGPTASGLPEDEEVLRQTRGVIGGKGGAAEILGLPISTLRNRMKNQD